MTTKNTAARLVFVVLLTIIVLGFALPMLGDGATPFITVPTK